MRPAPCWARASLFPRSTRCILEFVENDCEQTSVFCAYRRSSGSNRIIDRAFNIYPSVCRIAKRNNAGHCHQLSSILDWNTSLGFGASPIGICRNIFAIHNGSPAGRGSDHPETDGRAQSVIFVLDGTVTLTIENEHHELEAGGYAYIPAGAGWKLHNTGDVVTRFHWIRKQYEMLHGLTFPDPIVANERDILPTPMPDTDGRWATTRFVDPSDMRHDMHVTIVTLEPGAVIPFAKPT